MQRRALLTAAAGSLGVLAGCGSSRSPGVTLRSGIAGSRPIDEPAVHHGLTADSGQYEWVRLLHAGDDLPTTDSSAGTRLSRAVASLEAGQFGLLTNLRTAGDAPAFYRPANTVIENGRLRSELTRESLDTTVDAVEAVGYAFMRFGVVEGDVPEGGTVTYPSRATATVGRTERDGWF